MTFLFGKICIYIILLKIANTWVEKKRKKEKQLPKSLQNDCLTFLTRNSTPIVNEGSKIMIMMEVGRAWGRR